MKYSNNLDKFGNSEIKLHEEILKLKVLTSTPNLYPNLVTFNMVPSIVDLIDHVNIDISIDVISLLVNFTDEDVLKNNNELAKVLVDALVKNNVLELLVQNIRRLSESDPDEATAIYNTLSMIENIIKVKLEVAELVCKMTKLLRWLLERIKV